jgi:hypothetical protein
VKLASRILSVLTFVLALAAPAAAQEPVLPTDPVAKVGERTIAKGEFDHWLDNAVRGDAPAGRRVDPPDFERCIAGERRSARRHDRRLSRAALRTRCRNRYGALRRQVMGFLIQAAWLHAEAEAQGFAVRPEKVRRVFERQRRSAFPRLHDFRRFLRNTGATEADILFRVELDILGARLIDHATDSARPVTRADVTRYLARHPRTFPGVPRTVVRRRVHRLIEARRRTVALIVALNDFRDRYHDQTSCAQAYVVTECGDALPAQ